MVAGMEVGARAGRQTPACDRARYFCPRQLEPKSRANSSCGARIDRNAANILVRRLGLGQGHSQHAVLERRVRVTSKFSLFVRRYGCGIVIERGAGYSRLTRRVSC